MSDEGKTIVLKPMTDEQVEHLTRLFQAMGYDPTMVVGGPQPEPEFTAPDGTVRKAHYGTGRQPWDDIKDAGWAPEFAAGNALKYVRRAAAKNGEDDLKKARWYFNELNKLAIYKYGPNMDPKASAHAIVILNQLEPMLTAEERSILQEGLETL